VPFGYRFVVKRNQSPHRNRFRMLETASLPSQYRMPSKTPPWKRPRPSSAQRPAALSPALKAAAKARADAAGRRYPNLVDNMWAARQRRGSSSSDESE
jgi:hypothetical protein